MWHIKETTTRDFSDTPKFIRLFNRYKQDLIPKLELSAGIFDYMWRKTVQALSDRRVVRFKKDAALAIDRITGTVLACDKVNGGATGKLRKRKK